ncbi:MAG: RNA polymerase sigma-70 factor (ECF subfamily) [Arenicella sp.]|jgi:RNA polymerase sigma-70 factor (ECF subfamily)
MTSYRDLSDAKLMLMVCNANHDAFAELVKRHTQNFFALAFRTLQSKDNAEDIVQNSFIKLWQKPHSWNSEKSLFTTWFYRVIINACHDHIRCNKRFVYVEPQVIENAMSPMSSEQSNLEAEQELKRQQRYLEMGLAKLSGAQRDAINLVVYCALPQKQAASIMGVGLKALESLLVRAKRALVKNVAQLQSDETQQVSGMQVTHIKDLNSKPILTNFN